MSVHWELTTVMLMLNVLTLMEISAVPATLALREMESTALVCVRSRTIKNAFLLYVRLPAFSADKLACSYSDLNDCHENASCTDTDGSFNCTCNPGFEGDGVNCTGMSELTRCI